jgi:hypothetical protein
LHFCAAAAHSGRAIGVLLELAYPEALAWSPDGLTLAVGMGESGVMVLELNG